MFLLLVCVTTVLGCQPPMALFQAQQPPVRLAAPHQQESLVSGVSSHSNSHAAHPILIDNSLDVLTPMSENSDDQPVFITPYPGYIPPPPAHAAQLDAKTVQGPSRTQLNENLPLPFNCGPTINDVSDFVSCLMMLPSQSPDPTQLSCTFEEGTGCRFYSLDYNAARLPTESHYSFVSSLNSVNGAPPTDAFTVAIIKQAREKLEEISLSTRIGCQRGNGIMSFRYWILGAENTILQVCTQDETIRSCTQPIRGGSPSVSVEVVHPTSEDFDLLIVASNLTSPRAIIFDDIDYRAQLCENEILPMDVSTAMEDTNDIAEEFFAEDFPEEQHRVEGHREDVEFPIEMDAKVTASMVAATTSTAILPETPDGPPGVSPFQVSDSEAVIRPRSAVCQQLECSFETDTCNYVNYHNESLTTDDWKVGNSAVGNPHTGIRKDSMQSGFLYVGADTNSQQVTTYVLESPILNMKKEVKLTFELYRRSNDITLQICVDTPFYCPYTASPFNKDLPSKQLQEFHVPTTAFKIFFKAIQWRRNKWLAIDNLRIEGC